MRVLLPTLLHQQSIAPKKQSSSSQPTSTPYSSDRLDSPTSPQASSLQQPEAAAVETTQAKAAESSTTGTKTSDISSPDGATFAGWVGQGIQGDEGGTSSSQGEQVTSFASVVSAAAGEDDGTTRSNVEPCLGVAKVARSSHLDLDQASASLNTSTFTSSGRKKQSVERKSQTRSKAVSSSDTSDSGVALALDNHSTSTHKYSGQHLKKESIEIKPSFASSSPSKDRKRRSCSPSVSVVDYSSTSDQEPSASEPNLKLQKVGASATSTSDSKNSFKRQYHSSSSSSSSSMGYKSTEKTTDDHSNTTNKVITLQDRTSAVSHWNVNRNNNNPSSSSSSSSSYRSQHDPQWQNFRITSNQDSNPAAADANDCDPASDDHDKEDEHPLESRHSTKRDVQNHVPMKSHRSTAASVPSSVSFSDRSNNNNNNNNNNGSMSLSNRNQFKTPAQTTSASSSTTRTRSELIARLKKRIVQETKEETDFKVALKKKGLEMVVQDGDGNCLFRAVSLQIFGDAEVHMDVRKSCVDFMAKDREHFAHFIEDEPFDDYIKRKRCFGVHGNNPEIQAISELYNRPVEVYVPHKGADPLNIFHAEYKTCDVPIRLSYHDGNHYNAVVDPNLPTAGLGLGLPGLEVGLADKMQLQKAVDESDKFAQETHEKDINRAIVESKKMAASSTPMDFMNKQKALTLSDMEATDIELEQAALLSSLETYQQTEVGRKQSYTHQDDRRQQKQSQQQEQQSQQHELHQNQTSPSAYASLSSQASHSASVQEASYSSSSRSTSNVASLASAVAPSAAFAASVSSSAPTDHNNEVPKHLLRDDEYPQCVQELIMNGFEFQKVVKAYELIGDSFDDLLAYLMNSVS